MMGGAVVSHNTAPVEGKGDGQILQADIMEYLVVGSLEEGGIHGKHRPVPLGCQTGRKGDGMLFGDPHVEEALRIFLGKTAEPGTIGHGRGDGYYPLILCSQLAEGGAEEGRV